MPPPDPLEPDEHELRAVRWTEGPPAGNGHGDRDTPDADEVALRHLGSLARSLGDDDLVVDEPPPDLWDAIAARTSLSAAPSIATSVPVAPRDVELSARQDRPQSDARSTKWLWLAAAAFTVVVAAFTVVVQNTARDDSQGELLASASVAPLADGEPGSSVTADLRESDDRLLLDLPLSDAGLPAAGADFYEVWLIDPNVEGMISLGPARNDGTYSVPADVDYRDFPIVDVSVEPADGDPTHSGVSVLRGTLSR
jgi:hypothetical protein